MHFRAREAGQISLFGSHTGVVESIDIPAVTSDVSRREILNWERELIGLYISDHPLNPVMDSLAEFVTHFSAQLGETASNEKIRVAGIISHIRQHTTRNGQEMGFVMLEDLQGTVELIVFPKLWRKFGYKLKRDQIILVDGRVDDSGLESKILVSRIRNREDLNPPQDDVPLQNGIFESIHVGDSESIEKNSLSRKQTETSDTEYVEKKLPPGETDLHQPEDTSGEIPIPVGEFNDRHIEPEPAEEDLIEKVYAHEKISGEDQKPVSIESQANLESKKPEQILPPPGSLGIQSFILSPTPSEDTGNKVNMITIVVRCTGDKARDDLKIRRIYGVLTSYPGNDRLALHVFENGRGFLLEFPNCTVGICDELKKRISQLVGTENIRIDKIVFQ
jgi:DNA polymerase-3 subunit alpha